MAFANPPTWNPLYSSVASHPASLLAGLPELALSPDKCSTIANQPISQCPAVHFMAVSYFWSPLSVPCSRCWRCDAGVASVAGDADVAGVAGDAAVAGGAGVAGARGDPYVLLAWLAPLVMV